MEGPPGCVFIADDDPSIRKSLATLLSTQNYAIETFASADEYLQRVPQPGLRVSRP
jgi:FixJ family two-component response regulator